MSATVNDNSGVYSAVDIVGKTLIASKKVPVYKFPSNKETPYGYVDIGQPVGVVYSWVDADPSLNRTGLWWSFAKDTGATSFYWTPHIPGNFSVDALKQQGVLTEEEKAKAEEEKNKAWWEKLTDKILPVIVTVVIGAAVINAVGRGVFSRKNSGNG